MDTDSQASIQHQDTTLGPGCQKTTLLGRSFKRRIIVLESNIDVGERRGSGRWWSNRKAKAVSLIVIVVWILADNDGLDLVQGSIARPNIQVRNL